ncbi:MAG: hypothetical protein WBM69_09525 [Desulfobacterales bacterium]
MKPESKKQKNTGNHKIDSVLKKPFPLEKIEKPGLLKRFLDWIARGADKSNMGKASCPT